MPKAIDWSKLADFEKEDTTSGGRELACTADACEVVDLTSN
jgi:ribonucleoside-triphosphate reductase